MLITNINDINIGDCLIILSYPGLWNDGKHVGLNLTYPGDINLYPMCGKVNRIFNRSYGESICMEFEHKKIKYGIDITECIENKTVYQLPIINVHINILHIIKNKKNLNI